MIPQGFVYNPRSPERHWMLATVAVLFSAFLHLGILYFFADYTLSNTSLAERTRRLFNQEYTPPMHVEVVRSDPLSQAEKVPGERDIPNRAGVEIKALESAVSLTTSPALTAPPPVPREALNIDAHPIKRDVDENPFIPRQAIYDIHDQNIKKELAAIPIREIPEINRIPKALDIVPQMDLSGKQASAIPEPPPLTRTDVLDSALTRGPQLIPHSSDLDMEMALSRFGSATAKLTPLPPAVTEPIPPPPPVQIQTQVPKDLPPADRKIIDTQNKIENIRESVKYTPIDEMLSASLTTYKEDNALFFKVAVQPRKDQPITVIPKDVIWVLDVSGSMSEGRLTFCRKGLIQALDTLNPGDRFTVIAFRNTVFHAFPTWQTVTPESIKKATAFIQSLRAYGTTDVLGSLRRLMSLPRDPTRPMIAMIITDGKPTAGVTESSGIIGAFTRLNKGMVSIYSFGTHGSANAYLLDMLTYCNRGNSTIIRGNRWDIPDEMASVFLGFRNPVLSDASIIFDASSDSEVYPRRTANLYLNRPIEVFGKCNATEKELVFQIRGLAGEKGYDSIFRLPVSEAARGTSDLKKRWASQKMFMLASLYSREAENRDQILNSMQELSKAYNIAPLYPTDIK
jgi:hypothetical protein